MLFKISFSDRMSIQEYLSQGISQTEVARLTGVNRKTIYREVKRCSGTYSAEEAQLHADQVKLEKDQKNANYRNEIKFRLDQLEAKLQTLENLTKGKNGNKEHVDFMRKKS